MKTRKIEWKKFFAGVFIAIIAISAGFMVGFIPIVRGANPSVTYASPDDNSVFADVDRGEGINITVNVTDGDSDLAQVEIWTNASWDGSWIQLYDSGALGGVAYHNHTVQCGNMTGSWTEYWYNVSANDGAWTNVTYNFTTEYVWGD